LGPRTRIEAGNRQTRRSVCCGADQDIQSFSSSGGECGFWRQHRSPVRQLANIRTTRDLKRKVMTAIRRRIDIIADGMSVDRAARWSILSAEVAQLVAEGCGLWHDPDLHLLLTTALQNAGDRAFIDRIFRASTDRVRECSQSEDSMASVSKRRKLTACSKHDPTGTRLSAGSAALGRIDHANTIVVANDGDLFGDFLPSPLLGACDRDPFLIRLQQIQEAMESIRLFDSVLFDEITHTISCVSLVNPGHTPGFSCRMDFFGCIFVDTGYDGGDRIAETLIHEYMHQILWVAWAEDHPLPSHLRNHLVVSPVTGNERSLETLLQAYAIYAEAVRYYNWLQTACVESRLRSVNQRRAHLYVSRARLGDILRQYNDAVSFCDAVDDIWFLEPTSR
jgi:hypothetical protein